MQYILNNNIAKLPIPSNLDLFYTPRLVHKEKLEILASGKFSKIIRCQKITRVENSPPRKSHPLHKCFVLERIYFEINNGRFFFENEAIPLLICWSRKQSRKYDRSLVDYLSAVIKELITACCFPDECGTDCSTSETRNNSLTDRSRTKFPRQEMLRTK